MVSLSGKIPIILSLIIIALLIIFVVRPGVIGYMVYQDVSKSDYSLEEYGAGIQELRFNISALNTELTLCNSFNEKILAQLDNCSYSHSVCKTELSTSKISFDMSKSQYEQTILDLQADIDLKNDEVKEIKYAKENETETLKRDYDMLAQNLADNLCCKQKVDNPRIASYTIEGDMIICIEEGKFNISCYE